MMVVEEVEAHQMRAMAGAEEHLMMVMVEVEEHLRMVVGAVEEHLMMAVEAVEEHLMMVTEEVVEHLTKEVVEVVVHATKVKVEEPAHVTMVTEVEEVRLKMVMEVGEAHSKTVEEVVVARLKTAVEDVARPLVEVEGPELVYRETAKEPCPVKKDEQHCWMTYRDEENCWMVQEVAAVHYWREEGVEVEHCWLAEVVVLERLMEQQAQDETNLEQEVEVERNVHHLFFEVALRLLFLLEVVLELNHEQVVEGDLTLSDSELEEGHILEECLPSIVHLL